MALDNDQQQSKAHKERREAAPHVDFEAEHDPARARRVSNLLLRREEAALQHEPGDGAAAARAVQPDGPAAPSQAGTSSQAKSSSDLAIAPAGATPAAAQPMHQASQVVTTDVNHLDFTTVVGRQTLPQALTIKNFSGKAIGIDANIEPGEGAGAFCVWEGDGVFAPPNESSRPEAEVSVRFLAPTAGRHAATLVIHHDFGILRIPLVGTAMDIGKHAKTEATPGSPEPIHELPDKPGPLHTGQEARAQLLDAADAVSSLATTFDDTVPHGDQAAKELGQYIIDAAAELNKRILEWANDEGAHQVHKASVNAQASGGTEFIKSLAVEGFNKAVEVASDEDPVIGLAVKAVDWGIEVVGLMKSSAEEGEREEGYGEHMERVAFFGTRAIDATTDRLAHGFADLMSRYAVARDHLQASAGQAPKDRNSAGYVLGRIHQELAELDHGKLDRSAIEEVLGEAHDTVDKFKKGIFDEQKNPKDMVGRGEWAKALAAIGEAGTQAEEVTNAGYAALLDRYIQFKAGGGAGNIETRGGEVKAIGFIDFSERANIQLEGFTFGKFADTSPTIQGFIGTKSLADLAGWDVHIELRGVRGGTVTLHQGPAGPSQRDAKVSDDIRWNVDQLGGLDQIWRLLDGARLGTSTIWVGP